MSRKDFWWRHARSPLFVFAAAMALLAVAPLDFAIARTFFFDAAAGQWRGAGAWWANGLLHTGGRWLIRCVALGALGVWIAGRWWSQLARWQRPAGYLAAAIVLATGLVGLLKSLTNVDCPVDLAGFGGGRPYVGLLADRPDALPRARCFPAAHASSGYSLLAFYFLWHGRSPKRARLGLVVGIAMGLVFGIAQQARGAHFLSHDVWSAFLVWMTCLTLYVFGFGMRLHPPQSAVVS